MPKTSMKPRMLALTILSAATALLTAILLLPSCTSGQSSSGSTGSTGGGSQESAAPAEAPSEQTEPEFDTSGFIGTWHLVDLEQGDIRVSEANPDAVPEMYETDYFNINEDGSFALVQGDRVTQGTWEATSPSEGVFIIGTYKEPFSISDGVLVFVTGETTGYYALGEPYEMPSSSENAD